MPKTPPKARTKVSRIVIACVVIAAIATAVIIAVVMFAARTHAPAGNMQTTFAGTFVCLPHKGDGLHTLECAYGLRTADDHYYALQFDPPFPTNIEIDKPVEVTGTLTTATNNNYDAIGSIKVQSYHY